VLLRGFRPGLSMAEGSIFSSVKKKRHYKYSYINYRMNCRCDRGDNPARMPISMTLPLYAQISTIIKRHTAVTFFIALFLLLAACNMPSFGDPPRSDQLSILYHFHHIYARPGAWFSVFNYDPWTQARYYPLAHVLAYVEFLAFGFNTWAVHIAHFAAYCCLLIVLYRIAFICVPLGVLRQWSLWPLYAFLYSHSDLISWAAHTYIIVGFLLCLCGFMAYIRYIKTGGLAWVFVSALLLLCGMYCYETFMLWPLGILLLAANRPLYDDRVATRLMHCNFLPLLFW